MNLLTDDAPDHLLEAEAERARKTAFQSLLSWKGQPLKWTSSRAGLYDFLRIPAPVLQPETLKAIKAAKDAPDDPTAQQTANDLFMRDTGGAGTGHLRNAQLILWLACHQPRDWASIAHDRARLLIAIDGWIDEQITEEDMSAVVEITNALLTQADSTRAIPRPRAADEDEAGN